VGCQQWSKHISSELLFAAPVTFYFIMRTTKTNLYDYRKVRELYDDETTPDRLIEELTAIIRYYKNGDDYHTRHFSPTDRGEYQDAIEYLQELRDVAEAMTHEQETAIYVEDEYMRINVVPFMEYMRNHSFHEIILRLRMIKGNMTKYLHDQVIYEYKNCTQYMERLEWFFLDYLVMEILEDE